MILLLLRGSLSASLACLSLADPWAGLIHYDV